MVRVWSHSLLFVLLAVTYRFGFASDAPADRQLIYDHGSVFGQPYGSSPYGSPSYNYPYGGPYPSPYDPYPYPPYPTQRPARRGISSSVILAIFLALMRSKTATTAAPTTTADPCPWGTWSACSASCGGTKTRSRTCSGVAQVENMACNPAVAGFQADGWYRATNCYEYSWRSADVNYAAAVAGCTALSAKLAGKGMRDNTIRADVLTNLASSVGAGAGTAYLGVTDEAAEGTYVWSDGVTATPTFWLAPNPTGAGENCAVISIGNPFSLNDVDCTAETTSYICERAAA